jgi:hypothetical protein
VPKVIFHQNIISMITYSIGGIAYGTVMKMHKLDEHSYSHTDRHSRNSEKRPIQSLPWLVNVTVSCSIGGTVFGEPSVRYSHGKPDVKTMMIDYVIWLLLRYVPTRLLSQLDN